MPLTKSRAVQLSFHTIAVLLWIGLSSQAHAACSWSTITPGTTASATQVMNNLDCLAPLASPAFTGSVGIGTPTPGFPLEIRGTAPNLRLSINNVSGAGRNWTLNSSNGGFLYIGDDAAAANCLVIDTSGNVGIGTNAPGYPVELAGNVTGNLKLALNNTGASGHKWTWNSSSTGILYLGDETAGANRIVIDTAGKVGLGTASPAQRLDVSGSIRQSGCTTAGTLSVNGSGDIICTSDARLKNVRGPYTPGLDAIERLAPQLFSFKPSDNNPTESFVHAGFIAQNVKSAIPEAVALQKSGYYSLDTTAILAASVNAIKQLEAENRRLRHEISFMRAAQDTQYRELSMRLTALARGREENALNVSASGEAQGAAPVKRRGS